MDERGIVIIDLPARVRTPSPYHVERLGSGRISSDARTDRPLVGIGFCLMGLMVFSLQDVIIKLMSAQYSIWQLAFIRAVVVLAIMCPMLSMTRGLDGFRTQQLGRQLLRGALAVVSYTSYYLAVSRMPLIDAGALYASAPLFVTLFSSLFLGESVGIRRWSAVIAGFVGVLVMLRPGFGAFQPVALCAVASAALYAYSTTVTRKLGATDSALTITVYSNAVYLAVSTVMMGGLELLPLDEGWRESQRFLAGGWQTPELKPLLLMLACGVLAGVGFFSLAKAYSVAPVSSVAPIEYTYLVWALALGFVVFGDLPGLITCVGSAIVIASGIYIIRREAILSRAHLRAPQP